MSYSFWFVSLWQCADARTAQYVHRREAAACLNTYQIIQPAVNSVKFEQRRAPQSSLTFASRATLPHLAISACR
jgi:hypothetical protein